MNFGPSNYIRYWYLRKFGRPKCLDYLIIELSIYLLGVAIKLARTRFGPDLANSNQVKFGQHMWIKWFWVLKFNIQTFLDGSEYCTKNLKPRSVPVYVSSNKYKVAPPTLQHSKPTATTYRCTTPPWTSTPRHHPFSLLSCWPWCVASFHLQCHCHNW